jgi:DNA repair exonuclease SbcCD ATPase subunit
MQFRTIKLINYRQFEGEHIYSFSKLNLLKGRNGIGKSNLSLFAPLFCIYGYTGNQTLAELSTKGKSKECSVEIEFDHKGETFIITRSYPTTIKIIRNGNEILLANNNLKQEYLNNLFGNVEYFRKFRMVDNTFGNKGSNFLEEGKVSLNKILLSLNQEVFNNIRKRLNEKKNEREKYNVNKINLYKHYPSSKRLKILNESLIELQEYLIELDKQIRAIDINIVKLERDKAQKENSVSFFNTQMERLEKYDICPSCQQTIPPNHKNTILTDLRSKIGVLLGGIDGLKLDLISENEIKDNILIDDRNKVLKTKEKIYNLKVILENRIKQKDFIYGDKDVLVIKSAIDELDKFYSSYITEWVKVLEPIINSVISKIGHRIEFKLDEKGQFDIVLHRGGQEWQYQDLSNGQKTVLSIAFKMALLLEQNDEGVIVADEGFGSLDMDNLNHIFDLFESMPFQLVCILHRYDEVSERMNIINLEN